MKILILFLIAMATSVACFGSSLALGGMQKTQILIRGLEVKQSGTDYYLCNSYKCLLLKREVGVLTGLPE